ncbi:MAG: efflux RND transporter periplasmic adaptor subunit [Clostridia bacterium]|jgi:multidrug efflux pump subunit AcrA (membrane-fusion protein)
MVKKILVIILTAICLLSFTGCVSLFPKEDELLTPPVEEVESYEYRTQKVIKGDIVSKISIMGMVTAEYGEYKQYDFEVNGYLDEVFVTENEYVEAGTVIATLQIPDSADAIEETYMNRMSNFLSIQERYNNGLATRYELRSAEIYYERAKDDYQEMEYYREKCYLVSENGGYVTSIIKKVQGDPIGKTISVCRISEMVEKTISTTTAGSNVLSMPVGTVIDVTHKNIQYPGIVTYSSGTTIKFTTEDMSEMELGDVVSASYITAQVYDALLIPFTAVTFVSGTTTGSVRILEEGTPVTVTIDLGVNDGINVVVLPDQGIDENTQIVLGVK